MKVALVQESFSKVGGAERVFSELTQIFPQADIYALEGREFAPGGAGGVRTTFLARLPRVVRQRRWALLLYPLAAETLDLSAYDVVVSSSSAFAKGIVTRPSSLHICYCHAPTRFLWDAFPMLLDEFRGKTLRRGLLALTLHLLRLWDRTAARRVDHFIANSEVTRARIRKYYRREATVIHPPVSIERFPPAPSRGRSHFLFVGRLSPYKRADLVVQTFNKLRLPLVVVGRGRASPEVAKLAGPLTTLRPFVSDDELASLYASARAVIFPSNDDFGIVPIEAMAAGTPVLALRRGGAIETVVEGITGEFFNEPLEELLADCVRRFLSKESTYDPTILRAHAARYAADRFRSEFRSFVTHAWAQWQREKPLDRGLHQPGLLPSLGMFR